MTLTQISSRGVEETLRWSLGASGTDHYTFTGPGLNGTVNDPTIYLTRGHTYIFENNSGGHPFYIKTSIANGGTNDAYNTGVTNNGGGNGTEIKFTVPHDSPDVLYYQCSSHSSMAGQFSVAGSVADGSITESKLADDAVTNNKLADSVVASIAANTAKTSNATHTGDVTGSTSLTIANNAVTQAKIADDAVGTDQIAAGSITNARLADESVNEAKLQVSNSPTNGYFLSAQSGNTGGLTWAQVAQPDLTNLSASNLTSGTIPDARFPGTLPAAIASNLTNIPAANLTGSLPAISGAALTGLASACTRVKIGYRDSHWQVPHYNTGFQAVPGTELTFDNVTSDMRYLIYHEYSMKSYGTQQWYKCQGHFSGSGGSIRGGSSNTVSDSSGSYTAFGPYIGIDYASNTSNRTYSIKGRSSYYQHSQIGITNAFVMVMEFKVT